MSLGIAILIAAVGIGYALSRVAKLRKELSDIAEIADKVEKPRRKSRREKRLEQIRAAEPEYVPPSIEDLVAEEIEDLGVDRIPGGEGVAPAVLLKVYRRDTGRNEDCAPENRRYLVADGVNAEDAGVGDVRLTCADHPTAESRRPPDADARGPGEVSPD